MAKLKAFTQEWMNAFRQRIADSKEYREIAGNWEGSVSIIINPDPARGVPETVYLFTDYWHGDVKDFLVCDKAKAESADFIMSGDYIRWKQIARKEIEATKALMQGKLKLKGNLVYVVRNVKTVNKVVDLLGEVDTLFPDD
ncbi:MAG TPA: SCP2 sterol-binding domain-containing protein [Syntrophales bacterium]|nr:SCP2 sterol-binding domain-containing protein [Syntrophales bacterium]